MSEQKEKRFNPKNELNSDEWEKLPLHDLFHQQTLLQKKIAVAQQMGNPSMEKQLMSGLALLQAYVALLQKEDPDPTTTVIMR